MVVMAQSVKRVFQDSRGLRVILEVLESQEGATRVPPGTEASLGTPVPLVCPEHPVTLERKAPIFPALFPENLENPVILVSRGDQV